MRGSKDKPGPVPVVLTCEHASCAWPSRWARASRPPSPVLHSHRGWDPGALDLARVFARRTQAPLVAGRWSRLLVELNRSLHHARLWSEYTRPLPPHERAAILAAVYQPFRRRTLERLRDRMRAGTPVVHLSVHSFTPRLNGQVRRADVGLLYDPRRSAEKRFCQYWREALKATAPQLVVRSNHPYRGSADGHTTALRARYAQARYLGLELEVNQSQVLGSGRDWARLKRTLVDTFCEALREYSGSAECPAGEE